MTTSNKAAFLKKNGFVLLSHIAVYLRTFTIIPLVIKTVGIEAFGTYSLLLGIVNIVYGISNFGVGVTYQRYLPSAKTMDQKQKLFFDQFYFHLLAVIAVCILFTGALTWLDFGFEAMNQNTIYAAAAVIFATCLFSQGVDYFRYTGDSKTYSLGSMLAPYGHIAIIFAWVVSGHAPTTTFLFLSYACILLCVGLPLLARIWKTIGLRISLESLSFYIKDIRLGFPLLLNYLMDVVVSNSDRFVLAYYLGPLAVGLYTPAYSLGMLIKIIPNALGIVLQPQLARLTDSGRIDQAKERLHAYRLLFFSMSIPFVGFCWLSSRALLELFGNRELAQTSYPLVPILALAAVFHGASLLNSYAFFTDLRTKTLFKMNTAVSVLNLSLNIVILFSIRSVEVAAWTTLASYIVLFALTSICMTDAWKSPKMDFVPACKIVAMTIVSVLAGLYLQSLLPQDSHRLIFLSTLSAVFLIIWAASIYWGRIINIKQLAG